MKSIVNTLLTAVALMGFAALGRYTLPSACPVGGRVRVLFNQTYYVRPHPGGKDIAGNAALGSISTGDGWLGVDKVEGRFFHITEIGWVLGEGLEVDCTGEKQTEAPVRMLTPSATITNAERATATATSTRTPLPQMTPTRLAAQIVYCSNVPAVTQIESSVWRVVCDYR